MKNGRALAILLTPEIVMIYMKSTFNLTMMKFFCIKINMNLNHSYLLSLVDSSCKTCKEADPLYTNQLFITTYNFLSSHFSLDLVHNKVNKTKWEHFNQIIL